MLYTDINNLTLSELCDLLAKNTTELLALLNQRSPDEYLLRDKKKDVETIQSTILKKKPEKTVPNRRTVK